MEPTEIQRTIIDSEGNMVVLASPGSGKTYVMSEKIKALLSKDEFMDYQGVIAISYTRKASANLKNRTLDGGISSKNSFFGTIDGFCLTQIVLYFGDYVIGYPEKAISTIKIDDLPKEQRGGYSWLTESKPDYDDVENEVWKRLFVLYKKGYVLVESLELMALHIYRNSIACRNYIKARFKYIFIDEYQDADTYTDELFREFLALGLTGIVVGDKNQSIFGFAHKDRRYLIGLSEDSDFITYMLPKNFRSDSSIINYSNRLLDEHCKLLEANSNGIVYVLVDGDEEAVADFLSVQITTIKEKKGLSNLSEIAILVKNSRTLDIIDKALRIPHRRVETTVLDQELNLRSRLYSELLSFYFDPSVKMIGIVDEFADYEMLSIREKRELAKLKNTIRSVDNEHLEELADLFKMVASILMPKQEEGFSLDKLKEVLSDEKMRATYKPSSKDEVVLMTLHKSKGLEFDYVFHLNMNEWELPLKIVKNRDFNNPEYPCYEQDLDLHYVGITRAKKGCVMVGSTLRTNSMGKTSKGNASEFLGINGLSDLRMNLYYSGGQIMKLVDE